MPTVEGKQPIEPAEGVSIVKPEEEIEVNLDDFQELESQTHPRLPSPTREEADAEIKQIEEADEAAKRRMLPTPPGNRPTWPMLEKWLQSLTDEQWSRIIVYLYRTYPVIWRDPKNIEVLSQRDMATRKYIKNKHGGGKYRATVNDTDRLRGNQKQKSGIRNTILDCYFEIPIIEAEPILDYEELDLGIRDNRSYVDNLKARGILNREGKAVQNKSGEENLTDLVKDLTGTITNMSQQQISQMQEALRNKGSDTETQVLEKTIAMMGRASEKSVELLMGQVKEQDPGKLLDMVDRIMNRMTPKDTLSGGDVFKQLLTMQESSHKAQMNMMEKLVELKTGGGDDETKMFERIKLYREIIEPIGGRSGKTPWHENLFSVLPSILEYGSRIVGSIVAAKMKLPATTPGAPPPPLGGGGGENSVVPISTNPPSNPSTNSEQPPSTPETRVDPNEFITQYGGIILNAISQGTPGDQFAESITQLYGLSIYHIASNIGKNNLLAAMQNNPEFMTHASPMWPQVKTFVDEFLSFGSPTAEESPPPTGEEEKGNGLSNGVEEEGEK